MFNQAIKILEDCHLQNADQERWMNEVLLKIYLNAAHCSLELAQPARAIKYARKVQDLTSFLSLNKAHFIKKTKEIRDGARCL